MVTSLTVRPARSGFAGGFADRITGRVSTPYWSGIFGTVFVVTQGGKIVFEASRHLVKHADTEHVSGCVSLGVEVLGDASIQPADLIESRIGSTGSGVAHRLHRRHDPPAPDWPTRDHSTRIGLPGQRGPVDQRLMPSTAFGQTGDIFLREA
jgi:hypothetical protein